ncbi:mechanosensitive ion channel [Eubacteriaceae bacterium ES3]|nr:mechanosensitive ion channel [Eubacteriaceae bacterium ES3]
MEELLTFINNNTSFVRIVIIIIGCLIIAMFTMLIKKSISPHIKADNWYKVKKSINFLGYLFSIILIIIIFSDHLGNIGVALGVASAGIAFALQEVITSVAGWIAILASNFYTTGDRVQIGGIKGDVIDMGILRTTVMELGEWVDGDLYNGRIVRIANSFVFKEPVFNYSSDFPFLWDEIKIPIKFESDYVLARQIMQEVTEKVIGDYSRKAEEHWKIMVRKYQIENASTQTMVSMVTTDNWIEFTIRYVVDYRERRATKNQLFTEILSALNSYKDKIKLASVTMDISPIQINLENAVLKTKHPSEQNNYPD